MTASSSTAAGGQWSVVVQSVVVVGLLQVLYKVCLEAYKIRLYAIQEFGRVIHEFDPYFNYRATEYLYAHGWKAFSQWFDYMVWYPLGRPVGTTIYPGMQVTAVWIKNHLLQAWSINDICCFIPAWFGVTATLATAWLTYECTRCSAGTELNTILNDIPVVKQIYQLAVRPVVELAVRLLQRLTGSDWGLRRRPQSGLAPVASAVMAACIMSIVPAHLLRSIGGGYDNESIAMTAMVLTFACWTASLRDNVSLIQTSLAGCLTGLAYFYMVAAWGGYVFVLNMIGVHAAALVLLGRYSTKLHRAYSCFYVVGTALAIQVPVVGWTPLKSLEQLGPAAVFGGMQLIEICERILSRRKFSRREAWMLRVRVFGTAAAVSVLMAMFLAPTGYFGPISARVRGLFVKHTKTGNPLVDSVAEHQAASPEAYFQYLHDVCYIAPIGFVVTALFFWNDSSSFLFVYGMAAYYFSHRMVRLILLTAPIASVLGGIAFGRFAIWMLGSIIVDEESVVDEKKDETVAPTKETKEILKTKKKNGGKGASSKTNGKATSEKAQEAADGQEKKDASANKGDPLYARGIRLLVSAYAIYRSIPYSQEFYDRSHEMAKAISHPTIIQKARTHAGDVVVIDDYREAYWWLRDHTPEDARIMAWWDYGYQITGIGNRTTIADGNTWNHEHIALLGRTLTSPLKEAHRIARHLADYVLIWAGGGGDDLAKSPHLRRIANSVYRGLCREPTCRDFGFYSDRSPTESMEASLLYKLHGHGLMQGVEADRNRFKEVFKSKYGKVRIYKIMSVSKESKDWVADPANRLCDAPGSWFCPGQYPPALQKILKEKKDFAQLEDFNRGQSDEEYQKEYMENLNKKHPVENKRRDGQKRKAQKLSPEQIDMINEDWGNNEMTSAMWELISQGRAAEVRQILAESPQLAHIRSEDGRGPMWWAHEYGNGEIVAILKKLGVIEDRKDENGVTPLDISKIK